MTAPEKVELPFLQAEFQKDLQVLFCRWRTPVTLVQFMEGYTAMLQLAALKEARFWLHDLRLRNLSGADEQQWFSSTFLPALKHALGNTNFSAYLMSPLQYEQLIVGAGPGAAGNTCSNCLALHYFTNEHDALEWLNLCRHRVAV